MLLECLGEPVRFQILRLLEDGSKTVIQLARFTHRHQTTMCHHLALMRAMRLVRCHNRSTFTFMNSRFAM